MKIYKTDNKGEKELLKWLPLIVKCSMYDYFQSKTFCIHKSNEHLSLWSKLSRCKQRDFKILSAQYMYFLQILQKKKKTEGFREVNIPTDADDLPLRTWDFEHWRCTEPWLCPESGSLSSCRRGLHSECWWSQVRQIGPLVSATSERDCRYQTAFH